MKTLMSIVGAFAVVVSLLLVALSFSGCAGDAESQDPLVSVWRWTRPTTGSPAVGYRVEHYLDAGDGPELSQSWPAYSDTFLIFNLPEGVGQMLRVAAFDEHGRLGPYAESVWYWDAANPGAPGAVWMEVQ